MRNSDDRVWVLSHVTMYVLTTYLCIEDLETNYAPTSSSLRGVDCVRVACAIQASLGNSKFNSPPSVCRIDTGLSLCSGPDAVLDQSPGSCAHAQNEARGRPTGARARCHTRCVGDGAGIGRWLGCNFSFTADGAPTVKPCRCRGQVPQHRYWRTE